MSRALLVTVLTGLALTSGCSAILAPGIVDLGPPIDRDGGPDAAHDASVDGGDAATRDGGCVPRPEDCSGASVDLDCDGWSGCDDLDCASAAVCCTSGDRFILPSGAETWASGYASRWFLLPSGSTTADLPVTGTSVSFGTGGVTRGLRFAGSATSGCAPLAFGFTTDITFQVGTLTPGSGDRAAFVLTPATDLGPLAPDLEVSIESDSMIYVRSGGAPLMGSPMPIPSPLTGGNLFVHVEVSPAAVSGSSVLVARVSAGSAAGMLTTFVQDEPFVRAGDLLSPADCHGPSPGLYYVLEGQGSSVRVGSVSASTLGCANPSQFSSGGTGAPHRLGPSDLHFGAFAAGGIGAPALATYGTGLPTFDLFTDASHDPRANETIAPVHFSIGHANASGVSSWPPPIWINPVAGMGAFLDDATLSRREPTVLVTASAPLTYTGFDAQEVSPRVYDIFAWNLMGTGPPTTGMTAVLRHDDVFCDSLRDPVIAHDSRDPAADHPIHLFFTCETGATSDIRAVLLDPATFAPMGVPVLVLDSTMVGAYGANGVRGPEPLIRYDSVTRNVRLRLYFIARSAAGQVVAMAQGQGDTSVVDLPAVAAFEGNPLLRGDEASLGGCPGDHCEITGLGLVKDPTTSALRVVLARRVDSSTLGTAWELLPVTQTLETFW